MGCGRRRADRRQKQPRRRVAPSTLHQPCPALAWPRAAATSLRPSARLSRAAAASTKKEKASRVASRATAVTAANAARVVLPAQQPSRAVCTVALASEAPAGRGERGRTAGVTTEAAAPGGGSGCFMQALRLTLEQAGGCCSACNGCRARQGGPGSGATAIAHRLGWEQLAVCVRCLGALWGFHWLSKPSAAVRRRSSAAAQHLTPVQLLLPRSLHTQLHIHPATPASRDWLTAAGRAARGASTGRALLRRSAARSASLRAGQRRPQAPDPA